MLAARHLASRCPPTAWEAYLLIAIFPAGARLRWCKVHVFVGRARPGRHALSALEALDGPGETLVLVADEARVQRWHHAVDAASCTRSASSWSVRAPGLAWDGFPASRLTLDTPRVTVEATVRDVGWWTRVPRVLSYFTGFGPLTWTDAEGTLQGLGLVEHAWGTDVPFDIGRLAPPRWQWDVLSMGDGCALGALTIGGVGLRTMGRAALDEPFTTGWRVRIRPTARDKGLLSGWSGTLMTRAGTLRYEARATTPLAPVVPGGGFVGTMWEGTWNGRAVAGTGFTELRDVQVTTLVPDAASQPPGG